jgi:predicted heme/steroid binding protein
MEKSRTFSLEELSRFNGKDGRPAYVAYEGTVYDVTKNIQWSGGEHQYEHKAGKDLTNDMLNAPHSGDVLKRARAQASVVGVLKR